MDRKQYLSALKKRLLFKLTNDEIEDILADMEECFEAGAAEGKSEEEICLALGEPKAAAASLLGEQPVGSRLLRLLEMWLPTAICAVLFGVYTYCGLRGTVDNYGDYLLPIMCVLPLIMWALSERRGFFTALAEYKCDFFTFFGSICMMAAELFCNEIPKRMLLKDDLHIDTDMQPYAILTAVFISAAMILLAVSLWKNAPKFFSAVPLVGIIFIVYNSIWLTRSYIDWHGDPDELYVSGAGAGIGLSFANILTIIFVCAAAFLIWSFIHRNALTLASAYSAITGTGFVFYWYNTLAATDPADENSIYFIRHNLVTAKSYVIWGIVISAAVLALTVIVKLASGKKVGENG